MHSLLVIVSLLSLSQALPSSLNSRDAPLNDCPTTPSPQNLSNGRVCKSTCLTDRAGGDFTNSYTGSFEACAAACSENAQCATAQYHEENGYCYLKSTVNPSIASNGTDTVDCCPRTETVSATGRICTPTCGSDRPGGDYDHAYTGTVDACIELCGSDPKCVTAQYKLDNGYCYLKDSLHDLSPNLNVDTIDCCPGPQTYNGRTCTTICGQDRPGSDYANQHTGSIDTCIQLCGSDPQCASAQYHIDDGYCYFKTQGNALVANLNVDTVDCS